MKSITIFDRETNWTHLYTGEYCNQEEYWWKEGNGSCDCNRAIFAGVETSVLGSSICKGCKRFIITRVDGEAVDFKEWNEGYEQHTY